MFSDPIIENLKYYVYILVDPSNNKPFYIGKGIGNRVFSHLKNEIEDESKISLKQALIKNIQDQGKDVEIYIVRHGLNEKEAFEIEATLIDFIQLRNLTNEIVEHDYKEEIPAKNLANIVLGHHAGERGLMTLNEILQLYGAEEANITDPVIIININRKYKRGMSPNEIYEATRASWVISKDRSQKAKFVLASFRGIVKEVFYVNHWQQSKNSNRLEFEGGVAQLEIAEKYRNKAITNYLKTGAQNPIRYVNC